MQQLKDILIKPLHKRVISKLIYTHLLLSTDLSLPWEVAFETAVLKMIKYIRIQISPGEFVKWISTVNF